MARRITLPLCVAGLILLASLPTATKADPCGMVPPTWVPPLPGGDSAIARIGVQQTYVFYKDGVETFVIQPGFQGKVDEFGMLIPFPSPPAIRKVHDDIFSHIAAAIDPPEVILDLRPNFGGFFGGGGFGGGGGSLQTPFVISVVPPDQVRVVREEAVGMYEVAVLAAGSAQALKRWMDEHKYRFPGGMEPVCQDYVEDGWCFVAVKTKVGQKRGVDPRPGMRDVDAKLPSGAVFDGYVQAMGFRFRSEKLVVPMRLSAFNSGELRNIVYLLTDQPTAIRSISRRYVRRQLSGHELYRNLMAPLPVRVIGGKIKRHENGRVEVLNLSRERAKSLAKERDPRPSNGLARELFAGDLQTVIRRRLSHPYEESEKQLLRINEQFGLRGPSITDLTYSAVADRRKQELGTALQHLRHMTLTVVDGDFRREVLARENLTFYKYDMPRWRNSPKHYDAVWQGPRRNGREGVLLPGLLSVAEPMPGGGGWRWAYVALAIVAFACLSVGIVMVRRRGRVTP